MRESNINDRLEICKNCPIYTNKRCNSSLWINPETDEVSTYARRGFVRGCGCFVEVKARNQSNHCIAGKW